MKRIIAVLMILSLVLAAPFAYADIGDTGPPEGKDFVFPNSLRIIEEDAFWGTAPETVVLPQGFLAIGERAFAGSANLKDIYIPATTVYIGDFAIPETKDITVHGIVLSPAYFWAEIHGFTFVADNIWALPAETDDSADTRDAEKSALLSEIPEAEDNQITEITEDGERSMRPQDRPELNPIDYKFP